MPKKILIVDDDINIQELLKLYLQKDGYELVFASDGSKGLTTFKSENPDLVILDIMLPQINGWEVCQLIRESSQVPVLLLTAKDTGEDKLMGFDLGADDYVIKPFDPKEVVARVKALLKRSNKNDFLNQDVIELGELKVNLQTYEVYINSELIELKPKEMQLLVFLLKNQNFVLSRAQLLDKVWGHEFIGETRTVDVHVKRLRQKLGENTKGFNLKTIWGIGYKLEVS